MASCLSLETCLNFRFFGDFLNHGDDSFDRHYLMSYQWTRYSREHYNVIIFVSKNLVKENVCLEQLLMGRSFELKVMLGFNQKIW